MTMSVRAFSRFRASHVFRASFALIFLAMLPACAGDVSLDLNLEGLLRERSYVNPRSAADPDVPPFSAGVMVGNTFHVSGTLGLGPNQTVPETAQEEARNVLTNVQNTLEAAGLTMDDLVSVQVYASDVADYDAFNEVFAAAYGEGSIHPYGGILVQLFRLVAGASGYRLEARPRPVGAASSNGDLPGRTAREVCWPGSGAIDTPVLDRAGLPDGFSTRGPALMEDVDTVVAVPPGWSYALDERRTGWLTAEEAGP